jgi:hypothetical protein
MTTAQAESAAPTSSAPEIGHRRLLVIIGPLLLGMLLAALDQTIVEPGAARRTGRAAAEAGPVPG